MIVNHEFRFIFLKTRKTAGTSIDIALSGHCGPRDVISYLNEDDEALKVRLGYRSAQNFFVPRRFWNCNDYLNFILKRALPRYREHMTAGEAKSHLDPRLWSRYFKFCVERNPYDKAISLYYWRTKDDTDRPELDTFLQRVDRRSLSNAHIYMTGSQVEVDYIARYERLEEDLKCITETLGIPSLELPRAKGGFRRDSSQYRDVMDEESRRIVEKVCSREITLLGYTF